MIGIPTKPVSSRSVDSRGWSNLIGVSTLMVAFCAGQVLLASFLGPLAHGRWHLGAEYYNIAQAIVDGRGFSSPFGEETGPTAWMPPLLCLLYASLLYASGSKAVVAISALVLAQLATVVSGVLLFDALTTRVSRRAGWSAVCLYCLWIATFRYWFVELTSDIWLTTLWMTSIVSLYFAELSDSSGVNRPIRWGLLGGLCSLSAPALVLPWATALVLSAARNLRTVRAALYSAALAIACATPWIVRNAITLHELIPTKSNLGYELYQANVLDEDGIYDLRIMGGHPYNNFKSRFEYAKLGEVEFNRVGSQLFKKHYRARPSEFWRRVRNRMRAALLVHQPLLQHYGPWTRLLKDTLYASPIVLLGCALALGPRRRLVAELSLIWTVYIAPYILVAFYIRYALPLLPLLVVISVLGLETLQEVWNRFVIQMGEGEHDPEARGRLC